MTIEECIAAGTERLKNKNIDSARLDTLILIESALQKSRAWLLANPSLTISGTGLLKINKLLNQRETQLPIAYILSQVEFYGRNFVVNKHVLVPRPETEDMIDLLVELNQDRLKIAGSSTKILAADIGSGSGVIGITAKLVMPELAVDLIDNNDKALKVSKTNVDKYTLNINVIKSDLLSTATNDYNILLCNLPYVPDSMDINQSAAFEPKQAIFGGQDGLDVYRQLLEQIKVRKNKPLYILIEAFPFQHHKLEDLFKLQDYRRKQTKNFIVVFKLVSS